MEDNGDAVFEEVIKKKLKRTKQYQLPLILTTPGTYEKYLQKLKGKEKILKSRERAR